MPCGTFVLRTIGRKRSLVSLTNRPGASNGQDLVGLQVPAGGLRSGLREKEENCADGIPRQTRGPHGR